MAARQVSQVAKGPQRSQSLSGWHAFGFPQLQGMGLTLPIEMSPAELKLKPCQLRLSERNNSIFTFYGEKVWKLVTAI